MGSSTDAHCSACGYDTSLLIGRGLRTGDALELCPVSCRVCSEIVTANFKQAPLTCGRCNSTEVMPIISRSRPQEKSSTSSDLRPIDGPYQCPKCGANELRFGTNFGNHPLILWD